MLFRLCCLVAYISVGSALQLNFYTSVGQFREEISLRNGYLRTYFTHEEYNSIIPGTIDFPGQRIIEQDLYNSNEELRYAKIYVRLNQCANNLAVNAELVDPYSFLIKYNSIRYMYVSRDQIEYETEPAIDGMILSVRFENQSVTKTNMTRLSRGLWWTPRYEVVVGDDHAATLRALADIHNEQQRSYSITDSQLITGTVPLASTSLRVPASSDAQRIEYMASPMSDASATIASKPDATNFGTYFYNITRQFTLLPRSIKTFPFLSTTIILNYTLETTTYLLTGTTSGLFQRVFIIQPAEFLPAGTVTFYLASTGLTLGQSRLSDTPKESQQRISLGTDPEVKFHMTSVVTAVRQAPTYGQDLDVNVIISNRKEKQPVSVTLTMNSAYRNTTLAIRTRSSANITIEQDPSNPSLVVIRATVRPEQDEACMFVVIQTN